MADETQMAAKTLTQILKEAPHFSYCSNDYERYLIETGRQMAAEEIFEAGEKPCEHYGNKTNRWRKRCCDDCWQALKKERIKVIKPEEVVHDILSKDG